MISHVPVLLEHESNGAVSAYVVGLPGVFAAADSERAAASAIREALRAHLAALSALTVERRRVRTSLRVARASHGRNEEAKVGFVGLGALLGRRRSAKKTAAARQWTQGRPVSQSCSEVRCAASRARRASLRKEARCPAD